MRRRNPMRTVHSIPSLPDRSADAHKGMVGRIAVLAGRLDEQGMVGAAALTANGALRAGAGLVQVITTTEVQPLIALLAPCATTRTCPTSSDELRRILVTEFGADVVAAGPGLAPMIQAEHILDLLDNFSGSIVLDADALNRLSAHGRWKARWPAQVVVTPHPGEMARLLVGFGLDVSANDRTAAAMALAEATGVTVVHKGAGTVVTDGADLYVNGTGNSGMATAGAGDVLTGVIAGLLGSGMSTFDAAVLGVYLHGLAGDIAAEEVGCLPLTAMDILDYLPEAFAEMESKEE